MKGLNRGRQAILACGNRLDRTCCCASFGRVGVTCSQLRHDWAISTCIVLTCFGLALDVLGFLGAYAKQSRVIEKLPWAVLHHDGGESYAGVNWVCTTVSEDGTVHWKDGVEEQCRTWASLSCGGDDHQRHLCQACKAQTSTVMIPGLIGAVTYGLLLWSSFNRYGAKDRPLNKFAAFFSALVTGANFFLLTVVIYKGTCLRSLPEQFDNVDAKLGRGLRAIVLSTVLMFLTCAVHLCLRATSAERGEEGQGEVGGERS